MAVLKLLDDFYEHHYSLIAIHGSLEDYRLAYSLNDRLQIKLSRKQPDLDLDDSCQLPWFAWYDEVKALEWTLVKNRATMETEQEQPDLFSITNPTRTSRFLIPELHQVDYFLKIDNEGSYPHVPETLARIKDIKQIVTAYEVDPDKLKSKNNLIFLSNA